MAPPESMLQPELYQNVNAKHLSDRYLVETKIVQVEDVDYSLSMLCLAYLSFPQFDPRRNDDDIAVDIQSGSHAFYDYASACWAMHLQSGIPETESGDRLGQLRETLETFVESHWSSSAKPLQISQKVEGTLAPMQKSELLHEISQSIAWYRKQTGTHGHGPTADDALDLWQITDKSRAILESMRSQPLSNARMRKMEQFYGSNWFKCPRINCYFYHHGFSTQDQRHLHVSKHERPFLCFVIGCHMASFGCTTENELKGHLFEYHGIDMYDDTEFPDPPKRQTSSKPTNSEAKFYCGQCPKTYTRKHNLDAHLRTHSRERPYECATCRADFTRKSDRDRHELVHQKKEYICEGNLSDGSTWGCKASFSRADILANHLKSRLGRKCIQPLLLQRLQEGTGQHEASGQNIFNDQSGPNLEALLATGKLLPSFQEFLRFCGLDESSSTAKAIS